jgi:hypothetical protein
MEKWKFLTLQGFELRYPVKHVVSCYANRVIPSSWSRMNVNLLYSIQNYTQMTLNDGQTRCSCSADSAAMRELTELCMQFAMRMGGSVTAHFGRTVARAVWRRLHIAIARVPARIKSRWPCDRQSGTGAAFLRVLRFPLPIIHSANCYTIITIYHPGLVQ